MGLGLLALKRSGAYRKLGYATLTELAERVLNLSGRKVGQLIGAAEALEYLPLLSDAYRLGRIGWGKIRAIHGLATPDTEKEWLDFAATHRTQEVADKVALSPRAWKHHKALKASLKGEPIATTGEVKELLAAETLKTRGIEVQVESPRPDSLEPAVSTEPQSETEGETLRPESQPATEWNTLEAEPESVAECEAEQEPELDSSRSLRPPLPSPPKTIRVVIHMTPDVYALYEQASGRIHAQEGRRVSRMEVVKQMARAVLDQGTARSRARHQVLVHTVEGLEGGWYETERGILPVSPEVLEEARRSGNVIRMGSLEKKPCNSEGASLTEDQSAEPETAATEVEARGDSRAVSRMEGQSGSRETTTGEKPPGDSCSKASAEKPPGDSRSSAAVEIIPGDSSSEASTEKPPGDSSSEASTEKLPGDSSSTAPIEKIPADSSWKAPTEKPLGDSRSEGSAEKPPGDSCSKASTEKPPGDSSSLPTSRKPIPNDTIRRLYARAGQSCERCGARGRRLHIHHTNPVCEGGGNEVDSLELLCPACHSLLHEEDFARKASWRSAREAAMAMQNGGVSQGQPRGRHVHTGVDSS